MQKYLEQAKSLDTSSGEVGTLQFSPEIPE